MRFNDKQGIKDAIKDAYLRLAEAPMDLQIAALRGLDELLQQVNKDLKEFKRLVDNGEDIGFEENPLLFSILQDQLIDIDAMSDDITVIEKKLRQLDTTLIERQLQSLLEAVQSELKEYDEGPRSESLVNSLLKIKSEGGLQPSSLGSYYLRDLAKQGKIAVETAESSMSVSSLNSSSVDAKTQEAELARYAAKDDDKKATQYNEGVAQAKSSQLKKR